MQYCSSSAPADTWVVALPRLHATCPEHKCKVSSDSRAATRRSVTADRVHDAEVHRAAHLHGAPVLDSLLLVPHDAQKGNVRPYLSAHLYWSKKCRKQRGPAAAVA